MSAAYCTVAEIEDLGVNAGAIRDISVPRRQAAIATISDYMDGFFGASAKLPLVSFGQDVRECCAVLVAGKLLRTRGTSYDPEDAFWKMVDQKEKWLVNISRRFITPQWIDSGPSAQLGMPTSAPRMLSAPNRGYSELTPQPGPFGNCNGGGSFGA